MKLFGWLTGKGATPPLEGWRRAWGETINGTGAGDAELRRQFDIVAQGEPDVELELEMLDALDQLRAVQRTVAGGSLPVVETHHRVIGHDACHFSAPASLPSDHGQAAGRVLLTASKTVFVGGGRTSASAWHLVNEVARVERDVLLARVDGAPVAHFRFNTYGDAVVCAFLARHLKGSKRRL
jgi:hypothetical protein